MTTSTFTPSDLLSALEAMGVVVEPNVTGDGLKVSGTGHPPADLLGALKVMKPAVLAYLARDIFPPKEGTPDTSLPVPSDVVAEIGENPPASEGTHEVLTPPRVPDWEGIAAQPGHCGSCGRSSDASQEWGALMVTCSCPAQAFEGSLKPLALHVGHRCVAYVNVGEEVGRGWRRKGSGKAWTGVPVPPSSWDDLPPLDDAVVSGGAV